MGLAASDGDESDGDRNRNSNRNAHRWIEHECHGGDISNKTGSFVLGPHVLGDNRIHA